MLEGDAHYYGEALFERQVDYDRAKNALEKRLAGEDPDRAGDENVLCFLSLAKHDEATLGKSLFAVEGDADVFQYGEDMDKGAAYYRDLRNRYGVDAAVNDELATERDGDLGDGEKRLLAMTFHPRSYRPLEEFYERQGMEDKALATDVETQLHTLKELEAADLKTASPEALSELGYVYAMFGKWDKSAVAAARFEDLRPYNLIGKDILLLCAIHSGDASASQGAIEKIAAFQTDRPSYMAARSVLAGRQTWEQVCKSDALEKTDAYLSQGIAAISLYYLAKGNTNEALTVISQSLPRCDDNSGRILLQSILFGSIGRSMHLVPPPLSMDAKDLAVIDAQWGGGSHSADVTKRVKEIIGHPELDFHADPQSLQSDPAVGWKKNLDINFEWQKARYVLNIPEGGEIGLRVIKDYLRDKMPPAARPSRVPEAIAAQPEGAAATPASSPGFFGTAQPSPDRLNGVKIVAAKWGTGVHFVDVTDKVKAVLDNPDTDFRADPDWLGDPAAGLIKVLVTTVEWNNQQYLIQTSEDGTISLRTMKNYLHAKGSTGRFLNLPPSLPDAKGLKIINATWGKGNQTADVTDRVKGVLDHPESEFPVNPDWLRSDPAAGWKKTLVTTFGWNGKQYILNTPEDSAIGVREIKKYLRDNSK
jgi:hypothetical protein